MEQGININLHNKFDIEVRDASTGKLKQQATAYNIVLNAMWTQILARSTFMNAIHVGTGTGTLDAARTSLFTLLVARSSTLDSTSYTLSNMYRKIKIQLDPAEYVGSTITEVGVASSTSSTALVTHALLKDSEGNPISILKTSTDVVVIYATIFFTIGTLPSYVKLTGIGLNDDVSGNQLLKSLISQTWSIETNLRLGTYGDASTTTMYYTLRGNELANKTTTLTTDAATKRINFPTKRFEVADANGAIQEIGLGGSFNVQLPNENYTGTQYTDVVLSGQDGIKTNFFMPSLNADPATIVAKINNVVTAVEVIPVPYYRTYQPSSSLRTYVAHFQSNTRFYYLGTTAPVAVSRVEWSGTEWHQTLSIAALSYGYPYTGELYDCPSAYFYVDTDGKVMVKDINTLATLLTYTENTSIQVSGFLSDTVGLFSNKTSSNSSDYNFRMVYTLDNGVTWSVTGNLVSTFGNSLSQLVVISRTNHILFQGAYSSPTLFRLLSYDTSTRTISVVSVPTATSRSLGCFSPDETMLVTYGISSGLDVFEIVDGVWTKTNIIPDTVSPVTYETAWFAGTDTFIAANFSSGTCSYWKNISGTWTKMLVNVARSTMFENALINVSGMHTRNSISPDGLTLTNLDSSGSYGMGVLSLTSQYMIKFATAPLATDEVKVSYSVKGIHKTTNYVVDVSGYIQFGG